MPSLVLLKNFRLVDESIDVSGSVIIEDGFIKEIIPGGGEPRIAGKALIVDGSALAGDPLPILMPSFVDLHAHFRDPGFPEKETLESASLAAVAGGFGTVICMANTNPVIDNIKSAAALKRRADTLGLIDLYPVLSLSKGMEGKELSDITELSPHKKGGVYIPLMLSEDGKDLADDELFLKAMAEARRLDIPISCHCDFGGLETEALKQAGEPRKIWSRVEENNAVRRVIDLGKKVGCRIHIAHVSTKEAIEMIRYTKQINNSFHGFRLSCEVMPHNFCLTEEDAHKMGDESFGRVNPPLRAEADRQALIQAIKDGTIDAIATDHAPHTTQDKAKGSPGFSGLETAFAASFTELVQPGIIERKRLSFLMSANPARLVGLNDRGQLKPGFLGDLVVVKHDVLWRADPEGFKTRGKNSPFAGRQLYGKIIMTFRQGKIVFET
jgi:dihydroorotase